VHYLAHYYIDKHELNPLFIVGLGLPDWIDGFSKQYNQTIKNSAISEASEVYPIAIGVKRHYAGDSLFHNHPLFIQLQKDLLQSFLNAGLNRTEWRLSILAHVGVELMIDRQIVQSEPFLAEQYYQKLDEVEISLLKKYFDYHNMNLEQLDFLAKFQLFRTRRYLFLFTDIQNIVAGLDKMYSQLLKKSFETKEKQQLKIALHNIDNDIRYRWQELLNDIKL
jgi:hypothetical protein